MKVTIEFNELRDSIQKFVQVGFMEAVRAYEPSQDRLRQKDVKKWLKMMLIDYRTFKVLVDKGTIKAKRYGTAINSPLYYSKKEIKQAMATLGLMKALNTYE